MNGAAKTVPRTHSHPKAMAEILAPLRWENEVAAAVGWQVRFIPRKATEAELTAEVKVDLNADSFSSESEACACE